MWKSALKHKLHHTTIKAIGWRVTPAAYSLLALLRDGRGKGLRAQSSFPAGIFPHVPRALK
jgi:hypothetical protein